MQREHQGRGVGVPETVVPKRSRPTREGVLLQHDQKYVPPRVVSYNYDRDGKADLCECDLSTFPMAGAVMLETPRSHGGQLMTDLGEGDHWSRNRQNPNPEKARAGRSGGCNLAPPHGA